MTELVDGDGYYQGKDNQDGQADKTGRVFQQ
jgi:hypothetical protein